MHGQSSGLCNSFFVAQETFEANHQQQPSPDMSMIFMRTQALHVHDFVFTSKQLLVWVKVRCTFHIHKR